MIRPVAQGGGGGDDDDDDDDVGCSFAGNTQFSHDIIDALIYAVAQTDN